MKVSWDVNDNAGNAKPFDYKPKSTTDFENVDSKDTGNTGLANWHAANA
jgi:hypothetical protein